LGFFSKTGKKFRGKKFRGKKTHEKSTPVVTWIPSAANFVAKQGDQNGRIFAQWAIVLLWAVLKKYMNSPQFWATFIQSIDYVLILTK
jgi:hypothetical protein